MKATLPLLSLALIFASCTTAYKSGQTPDDVYFSPARPQSEYVRQDNRDDNEYRNADEAYRDDRYLRMKIRDRRYSGLYDDYYSYNPYFYHYYNSYLDYNSPWNSYSYWNYYYNPYGHQVIGFTPRVSVYNRARTFDLSMYNQSPTSTNNRSGHGYGYNSSSNNGSNYNNRSRNSGNYRNSGSDAGNFLRNAFNGSNNNSSNSSNNSSSSPRSSSSSSGSSGGSTNAPARRF